MAKGLLILLIVFVVVAILGWAMNKLVKVTESKKRQYQKYFISGYGIFLIVMSIERLTTLNDFDALVILQGLLGLVFIMVAIFGKIGKQSEETS